MSDYHTRPPGLWQKISIFRDPLSVFTDSFSSDHFSSLFFIHPNKKFLERGNSWSIQTLLVLLFYPWGRPSHHTCVGITSVSSRDEHVRRPSVSFHKWFETSCLWEVLRSPSSRRIHHLCSSLLNRVSKVPSWQTCSNSVQILRGGRDKEGLGWMERKTVS